MENKMNELTQRILTASALGVLVLYLVFESFIGFTVALVVVSLMAIYEFVKLSKMKLTTLWVLFIVLMAMIAIMWLTNFWFMVLLIPLLSAASIFFWSKTLFLVFNYPNQKPNNSEFNKAISLFLLIMPLTFLILLHNETRLLLLLLLIVWGADSFAYFSGKAFGRHKLAPNLSGGKTIEGVIGGLVGVLLITGVWMYFYNESNWGFLLLALVTGIFSVVGDLYESVYKREAGVKDSGNVLPGHGGILDRIDGLLAATPVFMTIDMIFLA